MVLKNGCAVAIFLHSFVGISFFRPWGARLQNQTLPIAAAADDDDDCSKFVAAINLCLALAKRCRCRRKTVGLYCAQL